MKAIKIPESLVQTAFLWVIGYIKVPLIGAVSPRIIEMNGERAEIMIPLRRKTKNHLGSMYFGALSIGADCAGGLLAMEWIRKLDPKVSLVFKDFHADFLKRPTADVHFSCEIGQEVRACVQKAIDTGERQSIPMPIVATCPSLSGDEPVAKFVLTLSLKKNAKKN